MEVDKNNKGMWGITKKLQIVLGKKKLKIITFPKQDYQLNKKSELIS